MEELFYCCTKENTNSEPVNRLENEIEMSKKRLKLILVKNKAMLDKCIDICKIKNIL